MQAYNAAGETRAPRGSAEADALKCGICWELLSDVAAWGTVDRCPHVFCFDCITKWALQTNICPFCSKRFHQVRKVDNDEGATLISCESGGVVAATSSGAIQVTPAIHAYTTIGDRMVFE